MTKRSPLRKTAMPIRRQIAKYLSSAQTMRPHSVFRFLQDEEAELLAELERIKKEREEEARKKVVTLCDRA